MGTTKYQWSLALIVSFCGALSNIAPAFSADGHQIFRDSGAPTQRLLPPGRYQGVFEAPIYTKGSPCWVDVVTVTPADNNPERPWFDVIEPTLRVYVDRENRVASPSAWMVNDFPLTGVDSGCVEFLSTIPYTHSRGPVFVTTSRAGRYDASFPSDHYINSFGTSRSPDGSFVVHGKQAKVEYRCVGLRLQ